MTVHTIHPYLTPAGLLVFDAPEYGLVEEPFVNGADTIILRAVEEQGIPAPGAGFELRFSDDAWAGLPGRLVWAGAETIGGLAGNWYRAPDFGLDGWLCPALLCYYEKPPVRLYFNVAPLPAQANADARRWYVIENGKIVYSCAKRNSGKAEDFALNFTTDGVVVLATNADDARRRAQP